MYVIFFLIVKINKIGNIYNKKTTYEIIVKI